MGRALWLWPQSMGRSVALAAQHVFWDSASISHIDYGDKGRMPLWEYPPERRLAAPCEADDRLHMRPKTCPPCLCGAGGIPGIGEHIHALYDDR